MVETVSPASPPIGVALAHRLADSAGLARQDDPVSVIAQKIQIVAGRGVLYNNLRDLYHPNLSAYRPAFVHRFLACLPQPLIILSTAYDTLLEDAFDAARKRYTVVTHTLHADHAMDRGKIVVQYSNEKQKVTRYTAKDLIIDLSQWSVIYKLHGAFGLFGPETAEEIDSIVVSEEDHIALIALLENPLTTIPNLLARQFKKCMFLFLGYDLDDWTSRAMMGVIQRKGNFMRVQPYAVRQATTELEYLSWESKRVRLLDVELRAFIQELSATMGIET